MDSLHREQALGEVSPPEELLSYDSDRIDEAKWTVQSALVALYIESNPVLARPIDEEEERLPIPERASRQWSREYAAQLGNFLDIGKESAPLDRARIKFINEVLRLAPLCKDRIKLDSAGVLRFVEVDEALKHRLQTLQHFVENMPHH